VRPALSLEPEIVITDIRLPSIARALPIHRRFLHPDWIHPIVTTAPPASLVRESRKRMVALEGAVGSLFYHQALRKENP
jgi:hypothetical protein